MKKMLAVLMVLLLVVPAMATVTVSCVQDGPNTVVIKYAGSAGEKVRAFALDVKVEPNATARIYAVDPCFVGECNNTKAGYGIFPGTIDINSGGVVQSWGTPVAPSTDPGAGGTGLGTARAILEMGSLYNVVDANCKKPDANGVLCKVKAGGAASIAVSVVAEVTYRGGVVLEDGTNVSVSQANCSLLQDCYPLTDSNYADWVEVGKPDCWCYSINPRQCHGDADGKTEGKTSTWVLLGDLQVLSAAWNKSAALIKDVNVLVTFPTPAHQVLLACADFDHNYEGKAKARVLLKDLDILSKYWNKAGKPDPNCVHTVDY